MQSLITSKYQTTIPKAIRENLGLAVKDALEWKLEKGKVSLYLANTNSGRFMPKNVPSLKPRELLRILVAGGCSFLRHREVH